jgi:predicted transcriptional regulator YdeE
MPTTQEELDKIVAEATAKAKAEAIKGLKTQEEVDAIIKERIERANSKATADLDAKEKEWQEKLGAKQAEIDTAKKLADVDKYRAKKAVELGLGADGFDLLVGSSEEEIDNFAEKLSAIKAPAKKHAFESEKKEAESSDAAWLKVLHKGDED